MFKNIITNCLLMIFLLSSTINVAQQVDINKQFKNFKPRNIGPAAMSGRITSIDAVVLNPNIIWLGAASGGVWKTENSGTSWNPVFDEQPKRQDCHSTK